MPIQRNHVRAPSCPSVLIPQNGRNVSESAATTPSRGLIGSEDSFVRSDRPSVDAQTRLNEINAKHPRLADEIKVASAELAAATERATWKGLKWYEKSLLLAFPFGGLALAGIIDSLRLRADDTRAKLNKLTELRSERDVLRA